MYENLAVLASFIFVYSLIAGRIERMALSGPIIFMFFGLVAGPVLLGILNVRMSGDLLRTSAELALALVLFTDASNARLGVLKHSIMIPVRLLLIGLPLTILLGFGFGVLVFRDFTLFEIAVLSTMLAPTDAALGKAVVTNHAVPTRIREALSVESGLNDGICVPLLLLFLVFATGSNVQGKSMSLALSLFAEAIGIGLAVGLVLTFVGDKLLNYCSKRGWTSDTWQQVMVVALAFACFAVAQSLGGSGFIASFSGGVLFGYMAKYHKSDLLRPAEGIGDTLALVTWVMFGAGVIGQVIGKFTWTTLVYAVLSLSVIRMAPVYFALAGTGLKPDRKLFMGWFGPRGLASIVFAVIVLDRELPHGETLALVVVCTVFLSILAHGFSGNPLANMLGAEAGSGSPDPVPENTHQGNEGGGTIENRI